MYTIPPISSARLMWGSCSQMRMNSSRVRLSPGSRVGGVRLGFRFLDKTALISTLRFDSLPWFNTGKFILSYPALSRGTPHLARSISFLEACKHTISLVATSPFWNKAMNLREIESLLGAEARSLLNHEAKISRKRLHLPGPDSVDRVWAQSDRTPAVLRNMALLFNTGRLAGSGYVSILPVDQGIEHSAGASFAPNPDYFDPENICKLGLEGGCNAVASTLGILAAVSRKYAHKIPFVLKINHNEFLSYPNSYDQIL